MKIGVITYYRVANFGANLQAISTYKYLEAQGHIPVFIHYMSKQLYEVTDIQYNLNRQIKTHLDFVDSVILNQSKLCFTADDINSEIHAWGIEAIVFGSDAILQHHSKLERMNIQWTKFRSTLIKLPHVSFDVMGEERIFPNLFWGIGIENNVPKALMSVSSQNSLYKLFLPWIRHKMNNALRNYSYLSVRDDWTKKMLNSIGYKNVPKTPDPVFAFNYNVGYMIPNYSETISKFNLSEKYILVSFLNAFLSDKIIEEIGFLFEKKGYQMVALTSQIGIRFKHNFQKEIDTPLSPIDWYALIKYSSGYIGNNMHPIIVALHNGVPVFSIDNYSNYDKRGNPINDKSSKIFDILSQFGLEDNYYVPDKNIPGDLAKTICDKIINFNTSEAIHKSEDMYARYLDMMNTILQSFTS